MSESPATCVSDVLLVVEFLLRKAGAQHLLTGLILVIFFITLVKFFIQDPFVGVIASCFKFR